MKKDPIAVIACAVLGSELKSAARRLDLDVDFNLLEAGLHERPAVLHQKLQAAIDQVSAAGRASRIIIGYGLCGRGTIGTRSRDIPLVMPRVHDCIAMLLGGNAAYQREFKKFPGTYYISTGWHKKKAVPVSQRNLQAWFGDQRLHRDEIARRHGDQAADRTIRFLNSWQMELSAGRLHRDRRRQKIRCRGLRPARWPKPMGGPMRRSPPPLVQIDVLCVAPVYLKLRIYRTRSKGH